MVEIRFDVEILLPRRATWEQSVFPGRRACCIVCGRSRSVMVAPVRLATWWKYADRNRSSSGDRHGALVRIGGGNGGW